MPLLPIDPWVAKNEGLEGQQLEFSCDECTQSFRSAGLLVKHCREAHSKDGTHTWEGLAISPEQDKADEEHWVALARDRPWACNKCPKTYQKRSQLLFHDKVIHQKLQLRPHRCDECGKSYVSPSSLRLHTLGVHRKERNYPCDECDVKCMHASHLKRHKAQVHSKEKKHVCPECSRAFAMPSSLKKHRKLTHSDESAMACDVCNEVLPNRSSLLEHKNRMHNPKNKYVCDICEARLFSPGQLREHMSVHSDARPVACDFPGCTKTYKTKGGLNQHQRRIHRS
ncbi:hypothetical protein ACJ41O_006139 [Fusarium nematophilum]